MGSRLNYVGDPEPQFEITPVGDHSPTQYDVERSGIGDPEPAAFDLLTTAQVKLAVAGNHIGDDELDERAVDLVGAVGDLLEDMGDARGLDDDATQDVVMGNLDALPEVTRTEVDNDR